MLRCRVLVIMACVLVANSFAIETINISSVFNVDPNNLFASQDSSIWYLGQIFGSVFSNQVFVDDTIITNAIKIFNVGLITFVGGSVATTICVSTVNASREGIFMGKMLPSAWYPLRVVTGVGFLAPTVNGYSGLQVLILWLVMQGVNLANNIWQEAADYVIANGGAFHVDMAEISDVTPKLSAASYRVALSSGLNILQAQSCNEYNVASYDNFLNKTGYNSGVVGSRPNYEWKYSDNGLAAEFAPILPANQGGSSYLTCGTFTLSQDPPTECFLANTSSCESATLQYNLSMQQAFNDYYQSLQPVTNNLFSRCSSDLNCIKSLLRVVASDKSLLCNFGAGGSECLAGRELADAAKTYYFSSKSAVDRYIAAVEIKQKHSDSAINFGTGGWVSAGNFYDYLASAEAVKIKSDRLIVAPSFSGNRLVKPSSLIAEKYDVYEYLQAYFNGSLEGSEKLIDYSVFLQREQSKSSDSQIDSSDAAENDSFALASDSLRRKLYLALANMIPTNCKNISNRNDSVNLCSDYGVDDSSSINIINLLKDNSPSKFEEGVQAYKDINEDAVASQTQIDKNSIFCNLPLIGSIVSLFVPSCDNQLPSDLNWIPGVAKLLGTEPTMLEEVLGQHVQVYIYQLGKAWLTTFSDLDAEFSFPRINVLQDVANFGKQLVTASFNFLVFMINDVYTIRYNADIYYLSQLMSANMLAMLASKFLMSGVLFVARNFVSVLGKIPFIGPIFIAIGVAIAVPTGIMFGFIAGEINYLKERITFEQSMFKARTALYIPIVTAVTVPIISLGLLLWLFLPMLPFLVYLFTVIGWFVSVIEAVLAGPIIATGVTNPQGHEFLGKAEQSLMLLISVVIRPSLILISFMLAVILTYVGVIMASKMMMVVVAELMTNISESASGSYLGSYIAILFLAYLYVYITFQVINYCLSVVYEIPAKVMRWIGTPREDTVGSSIYAIRGEVQNMFGRVSDVGQKMQSSVQSGSG